MRDAAEHAIRHLAGVVAVSNAISIRTEASASKVRENVEAALRRQARSDAKSIHVAESGGTVTLTGTAASWQAVQDASQAAWAAPGVTHVEQHIAVV